jgi:hypothetical protein
MRQRTRNRSSGAVVLVAAASFVLGASAFAAGHNSDCCADLEERIAELEVIAARKGIAGKRHELTLSGVVHRAILYWDDRRERKAYVVDNPGDTTSIRFSGGAKLDGDWKVGFVLQFDAAPPPSETVTQFRPKGDGDVIQTSRSYVTIEQKRLGAIFLGYHNSAARGIDNLNLAESDAPADSDVKTWNERFVLRSRTKELTELEWGDFVFGKLAGQKADLVLYQTPKIAGFQAAVSTGMKYFWDTALRYSAALGAKKEIDIKAGIGYFENRTERDFILVQPREDAGWGGSFAIRHNPSGLNIALNFATMRHTGKCNEPGAVSGKCRGEDTFYYVKGGIIRKLVGLGPTAFYGEYFHGRRIRNDSDEDLLRELELVANQAAEVKSTLGTTWGVGVVQQIEASAMELYLAYRHYDTKASLIDAAGSPVAARKIEPFDAVLFGAKIEF